MTDGKDFDGEIVVAAGVCKGEDLRFSQTATVGNKRNHGCFEGKTDCSISSPKKKTKTDGSSGNIKWNEELHRKFVTAIFELGYKHSSPSTILEQMSYHEKINTERIKSHLQKFRLRKERSIEEFTESYDTSFMRMMSEEGMKSWRWRSPPSLSSGEVAAYLSYCCLTNKSDLSRPDATQVTEESVKNRKRSVSGPTFLKIPRLTEQERKSPVGTSLNCLLGLFLVLHQQLMHQRGLTQASSEQMKQPCFTGYSCWSLFHENSSSSNKKLHAKKERVDSKDTNQVMHRSGETCSEMSQEIDAVPITQNHSLQTPHPHQEQKQSHQHKTRKPSDILPGFRDLGVKSLIFSPEMFTEKEMLHSTDVQEEDSIFGSHKESVASLVDAEIGDAVIPPDSNFMADFSWDSLSEAFTPTTEGISQFTRKQQ